MLPLISPASNLATQINVSTVKRFNPFGKFDFQILMILFLPLAPLNTQFIFSKHVESVILLWKYFVPMQNHFCEISFHSENAPNKLTICLFLTSCYHMHVHIFLAKPAYPDVTGLGVYGSVRSSRSHNVRPSVTKCWSFIFLYKVCLSWLFLRSLCLLRRTNSA